MKAAVLRWEMLTLDMLKVEAKKEVLSNDKAMQLGEDQLQLQVKIAQISTKNWKSAVGSKLKRLHRFTIRITWKLFPRIHKIIHRHKDARLVGTKTKVVTIVDVYLRWSKITAKKFVEFTYDTSGRDKTVLQRNQEGKAGGFLWRHKFFRVGDGTLESSKSFNGLTTLTTLTVFKHGDK